MAQIGWTALDTNRAWGRAKSGNAIPAYSEYIPPPIICGKPYFVDDVPFFDPKDAFGWPVTEMEEREQLRPGLQHIGRAVVTALICLANGTRVQGISRRKLAGNTCWPAELAERASRLAHERFVTLAPLALSRTQDDKGRVRWTFFGSSEQGPARAFWRSFFLTPKKQVATEKAESFVRRLLQAAYDIPLANLKDLRRAGFRVLPQSTERDWLWQDGALPDWIDRYLWTSRQPIRSVKFLLTFRPFADLPATIQAAYLTGRLHLLPCPGSLMFWAAPHYLELQKELALAIQVSLQTVLDRFEDPHGIRIPQSGSMHEPKPNLPPPTDPGIAVRQTYKRTHRNAKVHRHQDDLAAVEHEDKLADVIFSSKGDDIGLYGKPMARNVQLWDDDFRLLLDGPRATRDEMRSAARRVAQGGLFGYRFVFPAMRVARNEVYWHRPLVAFRPGGSAEIKVLDEAPLGYLTGYRTGRVNLKKPVELWPRLLQREPYEQSLTLFRRSHDLSPRITGLNVRKLLDAHRLCGRKLSRGLARALLTEKPDRTLDQWLVSLPERSGDPGQAQSLATMIANAIEPEAKPPESARTFAHTANRAFELKYWKMIAHLAEGRYINKSNADCVLDAPTQAALKHHRRDLEALGDHILRYYELAVAKAGMKGKALVGELPFAWKTEFDYGWMGGWKRNQEGKTHERNLICVIPGKDRSRAVVMADHYDTAYMADRYEQWQGGNGARLAAAGADDNHSATVALMLSATAFLDLSQRGQLGCDVWLIHLTGEEFPSDCLGARHLCEGIVERRLPMTLTNGRKLDLGKTRIQGVYVLDMIAHNNDRERDIFQIAPGAGAKSLWLAEQAQRATESWNAGAREWNQSPSRRGLGRGQRSADGGTVPAPAVHPILLGEVRPVIDPRSTLYNTDGQIFSDAGVPCVLFMENYDIDRQGYHDMHDTMENIDLDFGAAVAAIAIEAVTRAVCEKP